MTITVAGWTTILGSLLRQLLGAWPRHACWVMAAALLSPFMSEAVGAPAPVPLATGLNNPFPLAVDGSYVYWAELNGSTASLRRIPNAGGAPDNLAAFTAFLDPYNIYRGIDKIVFTASNMYFGWGSYDGYRIEEATKTGASRRVVVPNFTGGNLLGVINGYVYYVQNFCCIIKVPIDGSTGPQTMLTGNWVRSAAYDSGAIYFVEYFSRNVYRFDVATNTRTPLITGNAVEGGVVIDANNVFYSDGSRIRVVSKLGGSVSTLYTGTNVSVRVSDGGILYFTEGGDLKAIPVTGGAATLTLPGTSVVGMVQDPNALYWADVSGGASAGVIYELRKAPGSVQNSRIPPRLPVTISPPSVSPSIPPIAVKKSVVVIVHGWNSSRLAWPESLKQAIRSQIDLSKSNGSIAQNELWSVLTYDWSPRAALLPDGWSPRAAQLPSDAFANAYAEGMNLGNALAVGAWDHIHFIAHSAGSNLIQNAFITIMLSGPVKKPFTTQMTFLDAYYPESNDRAPDFTCEAAIRVPLLPVPSFCLAQVYDASLLPGQSFYGFGATWAEHYVDRRDTKDKVLTNTNRRLPSAFDFDVTQVDSNPSVPLTEAHAWPYIWYGCNLNFSIVYDLDIADATSRRNCGSFGRNPGMYNSPYGPKLSLEYGNLPLLTLAGTTGDPCTLITGQENCNSAASTSVAQSSFTPTAPTQLVLIADSSTLQGPTGTVAYPSPGMVGLATGSPAWVSFQRATTQSFNSIQFDYQFLSRAQGLLSVYVDDKLAFLLEEGDVSPGVHHSPFIPVSSIASGWHSLSIRLDPQTADQSIAQVSNFQTGTTTIVQVQNLAPITVATAPVGARQGSLVRLDGTASSDPDQFPRPLGYSWKQLSGPPATLSDWFVAAPTFTASQSGQYAFTLTVTDGSAFTTSRQVNIAVPILGDVDGDGDVDSNDLALITSALNTKANGPNDLRDLDGDGMITALDARKLVTLCTRARCATQ